MSRRSLWCAAAVLAALLVPRFAPLFWLQIALFAGVAVVGAAGLHLLVGVAGQLSLAHGFFIALGAYGYGTLASARDASVAGVGLHPVLAAVGAVAVSGLAGLLFSPIASRLQGVYLGVASVGLVFLGLYLLTELDTVTGGFNGRSVPPLEIGGFTFDGSESARFLGKDWGRLELLWPVVLATSLLAWISANRIERGRPGVAMHLVRTSELAAAAQAIDVRRVKAAAFAWSSMYAGLAGVLLALVVQRVVPESFGLALSVDYLAMIVLGGLGSLSGAALGAMFVSALPLVLRRWAPSLPLVSEPGQPGYGPAEVAAFVYGALMVVTLTFFPSGLGGVASWCGHIVGRVSRRRAGAPIADGRESGLAVPS